MADNGYELGLGIAEEHMALSDSVRGFTERHIDAGVLRTAVEAKAESLPPFWRELSAQGLLGLHVSEEHGGQGAGLVELTVALEALGRAAQPGPLLPTVLASALLVAADAKVGGELLPGLVDGSRIAAVGLADPLDGSASADGVTVSGTTVGVLGGAVAARAVDAGDDAVDFAAAMAAVVAPDAAVRCGADCVQVLGGIGFTWEHDAHLYYRRALTLRGLLGRSTKWTDTVARFALDGVARVTEIDLPEGGDSVRESVRAELAEIAALGADEQLVALGDGGWVQPHLPRPFGRDAGPLEQVVISEEVKRAGIQMPELLMGGWAVPPIVAYGTQEQKERVGRTDAAR
jgi:alkylation response protein AidB-like acyl-CoA dehydrogenase